MTKIYMLFAAFALSLSPGAFAQDSLPPGFHMGKAIPEFGPIASVESDMLIPEGAKFAVIFDVAKAKEGKQNRTLVSAARFINMHDAAGVEPVNIRVAVVVHGAAVFDMASNAAYARKYPDSKRNPNAAIIAALIDNSTRIIICGQSAAAHQVKKEEFLPGVEMALSAMTAHALLQQQGYTLNPF